MAFPERRADARDEPVETPPAMDWRLAVMTGWVMGTEAWIWIGAWALVMGLVVWLLVREPHHATHDDPGEILRARYARGEITEQELRRAMAALDAESVTSSTTTARHHAAQHSHTGQEARHD
jgi:uncharacterized membrane protein